MYRRQVLAIGTVVPTLASGCLDTEVPESRDDSTDPPASDGDGDRATGNDSEEYITETDSSNSAGDTDGSEDDDTDGSGDDDTDGSGDDDTDEDPPFTLYVENLTTSDRCVRLVVTTGGRAIIDGTYAIAGETGIVFHSVLDDQRHTISAETDGHMVENYTWDRRSCPTGSNEQDATIVIEADGLTAYRNQCDTVDAGSLVREYTAAETRHGCGE